MCVSRLKSERGECAKLCYRTTELLLCDLRSATARLVSMEGRQKGSDSWAGEGIVSGRVSFTVLYCKGKRIWGQAILPKENN